MPPVLPFAFNLTKLQRRGADPLKKGAPVARTYPEIRALGLDSLLVRFAGALDDAANRATLAFAADVRAANWPGVEEVAPALSSAIIRFDPLAVAFDDLAGQVETLLSGRDWAETDLPPGRRYWQVPIAVDPVSAPQLGDAAAAAGASADDLLSLLASTRVRVLSLGFAPGQPYMGMLPKAWNIPRQSDLTPKVPAGALVMAVRQLIIFTGPAPTGWRQVGLAGFRCFRPDADEPVPLAPGDEMSFRIVPADELAGRGDGLGGATCEVLP